MALSRPWADEDEMLEDERRTRELAGKLFGGGAEDWTYEGDNDA